MTPFVQRFALCCFRDWVGYGRVLVQLTGIPAADLADTQVRVTVGHVPLELPRNHALLLARRLAEAAKRARS